MVKVPDLEERVSGMETRLTQIETEIPHLKESLDRNTKSNEKIQHIPESGLILLFSQTNKIIELIHIATLLSRNSLIS